MAKIKDRDKINARVVSQYFDRLPKRVFKRAELTQIAKKYAAEWGLPKSYSTTAPFIRFLLKETPLRQVDIKAEFFDYQHTRYTWGEPRPYELALTIGKGPYISHASAVFLHGLTDQIPKTIYINDEQSPKNFPPSVMTQGSIDRAFAGKQRTTKSIWETTAGGRILIVSGKSTGRLEVGQLSAPDQTVVDATKIERTLIDIAVRPDYAGGPYYVRDVYAAARERVSMNVLVATLKKLNHAYPYHQVIGFYMKRAGYETRKLEALKKLGFNFDFYLTYGIKDKDFDSEWRLFFPKGF